MARVELIRLDVASTPEGFERAIRLQEPKLIGSLLTWLHDDWYALAPDVSAELAASGATVASCLSDAGAVGYEQISPSSYAEIALLRDTQTGPSSAPLRDRDLPDDVFIEAPTFSWQGDYQGKPVSLDWHIATIGLPSAWQQLGPTGPRSYESLKVGHIDTGYTEHPALGWTSTAGTWLLPESGKNYLAELVDPHDLGEGGASGWRERPEHPGPRDNLTGSFPGHGTRTMSVLGGLYVPEHQPIQFPFFGAAPGVPIIPYRITDSVLIDHVTELLAKAIRHAVAEEVKVISISLGAIHRSRAVAKAVTEAYRKGVIICAAAGNVVRDVIYPGKFNCVLTVAGATTSNGKDLHPWRGSSRGKEVEISCPADFIRRPTTVRKGGAEHFLITGPGDGTSFATALCAGVAVLWLARRSEELETAYGDNLWARPAAFKRLVQETAQVPPGWNTLDYGAGVLQADTLLRADLPLIGTLAEENDV